MSKAYRLFKQMLVAVIALTLLTAAWPSAAQGKKPQLLIENLEKAKLQWQMGNLPPVLDHPTSAVKELPTQSPTIANSYADWTRVVFQSFRDGNSEVYSALGDGTSQVRLTYDGHADVRPHVNRGATQIAFSSNRDGDYEIYRMNVNGTGLTQLTFNTASDLGPVWSPDGSRMVFESTRTGNQEIFVMNADGTNQIQLTFDYGADIMPAWSLDGSQIVWVRNTGAYGSVMAMNADGSNVRYVTNWIHYPEFPRWSPDNTRIAFDSDIDNDEWNELVLVNTDGTGQQTVYDPDQAFVDAWLGSWSPDGKYLLFTRVEYALVNGNLTISNTYVQNTQPGSGIVQTMLASGSDSLPDWQTTDVFAPTSNAWSPQWSNTPTFTVHWSGIDLGFSGIAAYDIQYLEEGPLGIWTDWLLNTTQTSAAFTGIYGQTYRFRSRAHDYAGNIEAYSSDSGDTSTTVYRYAVSGQVRGNRDQPVASAIVYALYESMNRALSRHDGRFDLYFYAANNYSLHITRNGFGQLPPLFPMFVPLVSPIPELYLPPFDDYIIDGQFESGNLPAWNAAGDITPTIATTAHTGNYAALLGGTVPSGTLTTAPYRSTIEQTITVPPTLTLGTLSLVYQIVEADPVSDTLSVSLIGPTETLTYSLPLTLGGWTHQWWDVSTWTAPTATVRIELTHGSNLGSTSAVFDDISWGSSNKGGEIVYLPVIYR